MSDLLLDDHLWKEGNEVLLETNDCFGSRKRVRIKRLCKAGTVQLVEIATGELLVNHVNNLVGIHYS